MDNRWLTWIEPWGPNQEPIYCFAPATTCVAWAKKYHPERTDEGALDDFMVVNWATFTEAPKEWSKDAERD